MNHFCMHWKRQLWLRITQLLNLGMYYIVLCVKSLMTIPIFAPVLLMYSAAGGVANMGSTLGLSTLRIMLK